MKKLHITSILLLAVLLTACSENPPKATTQPVSATTAAKTEAEETGIPAGSEDVPVEEESEETLNNEEVMQIQVQGNGHTIVFELNDSPASKSFFSQLPLTLEVEDYGSNEKIFYPPEELEIGDTPLTEGGGEGGLAYFEPWGDVIMYYDSFDPYSGLYDLGTAVSGSEWIRGLSDEILIEPVGTSF